jgi:N-methylhydantoinase A
LGVSEIVIPLAASVHSAFGVAASDLTVAEELSDPLLSPPGTTDYAQAIDASEINARFERLRERAIARLARAGVETGSPRISRSVEMRFRFQIHVLTVPVGGEPLDDDGVRALVQRFIETYEARFGEGSAFVAAGIELTTFRVVVSVPGVKPRLRTLESPEGAGSGASATRPVFSAGQWTDARIVDRAELRPGLVLDGLAVIELEDTTIVIGPGQQGVIDDYGNVVITDREGGAKR